jgi:tetratricopeptide (TPR) repeat protein
MAEFPVTQDEKEELEIKAERLVRRGDFAGALAQFHSLRDHFPHDGALARRIDELESGLQPSELHAKNGAAEVAVSPVHEAEALSAKGEFSKAIAIYRKLLSERPDWELGKERLAELFQLAQSASPVKRPVDRIALYQELLSRVVSRRRA